MAAGAGLGVGLSRCYFWAQGLDGRGLSRSAGKWQPRGPAYRQPTYTCVAAWESHGEPPWSPASPIAQAGIHNTVHTAAACRTATAVRCHRGSGQSQAFASWLSFQHMHWAIEETATTARC